MKTGQLLLIAALSVSWAAIGRAADPSQADRFQEAIHLMETRGDYPAAIEVFEEVAGGEDRSLAARALLNLGLCHESLGTNAAFEAYRRILDQFQDQSEVAEQALERLEKLGAGGDRAAGGGPSYTLALASANAPSRWTNIFTTSPYDFSPSGDQFVFRAPRQGVTDDEEVGLYLSDRTGTLVRPLLTEDIPKYGSVKARWSPAGGLIAFLAPRRERTGSGEYAFFFRIYVVDAEGGAPRQIVPDISGGEVDLCWTPDGRRLTYVLVNDDGSDDAIYTVDLEGGSPRSIPMNVSKITRLGGYSPDGRWLAFEGRIKDMHDPHEEDIWIVSATGGSALRLTDAPGIDGHATWARDGRAVYFVSDRGGNRNIWKVGLDPESGLRLGEPYQVTFFSDADVLYPRMLADGRRMAFLLTRSDQAIYVADVARQGEAVTIGRGHRQQLSPDGNTVYYLGRGPGQEGIFAIPREGGAARRLTKHKLRGHANLRAFHVSPDGQTLAYFARAEGGIGLFTVTTHGDAPQLLLKIDKREDLVPSWSRDGSLLAYASLDGLYVIAAEGGQPRELAHLYRWDGWNIRWSPDGNYLAALGHAGPEEQGNSVFVVPASGGEPRRLTPYDGNYKEGLEWHPDGGSLTFFHHGPDLTRRLYLDERPIATLFDQPGHWDYIGRWAPDGRRYFFLGSRHGVFKTFVYDTASGDITPFSSPESIDSRVDALPSWSRDGQTIAWTTRKTIAQLWLMEDFR